MFFCASYFLMRKILYVHLKIKKKIKVHLRRHCNIDRKYDCC